jgi:predicted phosphodiesterase
MPRIRHLFSGLIASLAVAAGPQAATSAEPLSVPWVEFGTDNDLQIRVVLSPGVAACPAVLADGRGIDARQRSAADDSFPVTVYSATVPLQTAQLSVGGVALPTVPTAINRIVVIGDTGCRIEGITAQNCDDPEKWPFPVVAKDAAKSKPDLVVHIGDYYYREDPCPADKSGCAGSPHGDNWAAWKADFLDPAAPLLQAAPWVMVRGNHELCRRGGKGWIRLLDPRADTVDCADMSPPYRVSIGRMNLLVFDGADADDFKTDANKVAGYAGQLAQLLANAPPHSWLVTHKPVWALAQGNLAGMTLNLTEQAAIAGHTPPGLDLVVSGHLHDFTSYAFGSQRPGQLIVGVGGDNLLDLAQTPLVGATIDGVKTTKGFALERFGFFVMERSGEGWNGTLYAPDGKAVLATCTIADRDLDCHR